MKAFIREIPRRGAACLILAALAVLGCSAAHTTAIRQGDTARIDFLCRLKSGEVAAATDSALVRDRKLPTSSVYVARKGEGPIAVRAGTPEGDVKREKSFEEEITEKLKSSLTGMKEGETREVKLTAEDLAERTPAEFVLRMARVRVRPGTMVMKADEFTARTGREPRTGDRFTLDPAVPGHIEKVADGEVFIRFTAKAGESVRTPLGPGIVREDADSYRIEIQARRGDLVRTGGFVGRISAVDEQFIMIDYRNPFGGEELSCDVTVRRVEKAAPATASRGE